MATKKWGQLTPRQIGRLDKDATIVVCPLGTMGASDETVRVWANLRATEDMVKTLVETVNTTTAGPLARYTAIPLHALWPGVEPGPSQPGTIALPRGAFEAMVEAICRSLKGQGIKYVVLVTHDDDVEVVARSVAGRLNQDEVQPWVLVYQPALGPMLAASLVGDVCRALAVILGYDPASCPP